MKTIEFPVPEQGFAPDPRYKCSDCRDRGWRVNTMTNSATSCDCRKKGQQLTPEEARDAAEAAGLPPAFIWYKPEQMACWRNIKTWPQGKSFLILSGPSNAGKTGVAAPLFQRFLAQGRTGRWISFPIWYDELKSRYRQQGEEMAPGPRVEELKARGILVLDDFLCRESPSAFESATLRSVSHAMEYRYQHNLATILTIRTRGSQTARGWIRALEPDLEWRLFGNASAHKELRNTDENVR